MVSSHVVFHRVQHVEADSQVAAKLEFSWRCCFRHGCNKESATAMQCSTIHWRPCCCLCCQTTSDSRADKLHRPNSCTYICSGVWACLSSDMGDMRPVLGTSKGSFSDLTPSSVGLPRMITSRADLKGTTEGATKRIDEREGAHPERTRAAEGALIEKDIAAS